MSCQKCRLYLQKPGTLLCGGNLCIGKDYSGIPEDSPPWCKTVGCKKTVHPGFDYCSKMCAKGHIQAQKKQQQAIPQLPLHAPIQCNNVVCSKPARQGHPYCGKGCAPGGERHKGIRCKNIRCSKPKHQQFDYCGKGCAPGGDRHNGNKW